MIRLLRWLITGDAHTHKWEVHQEFKKTTTLPPSGTKRINLVYVMRCEHCGVLKEYCF